MSAWPQAVWIVKKVKNALDFQAKIQQYLNNPPDEDIDGLNTLNMKFNNFANKFNDLSQSAQVDILQDASELNTIINPQDDQIAIIVVEDS